MLFLDKKKWVETDLHSAFWFQEGPGVRNWQFTTSGIKLLNVANITKAGNIDLSKSDRCLSTEEARQKYSHFLVDAGDLVIASSGISFDTDGLLRTRGAFVDSSHLPLCMNTSTIRFKAKEGVSDLEFLKFWFDSFEFRDQITRLVTGSAQQNFGPSHLKQIKITLPPLEEQKRITAIARKCDRLRRTRRFTQQLSDTYLQSVFLEMFGGEDSRNWEFVKIEDVLEKGKNAIRTGPFGSQLLHEEFQSQGNIAVLGIDNVVQNTFTWDKKRFITEKKYQELKRYTVFPDDVLITIMGTCGRCAVVPSNIPLAINTKHLCCLTLNQELCLPTYLQYFFLSRVSARKTSINCAIGQADLRQGQ
jgi:type I restriction enzyme S subunit